MSPSKTRAYEACRRVINPPLRRIPHPWNQYIGIGIAWLWLTWRQKRRGYWDFYWYCIRRSRGHDW